MFLIKLLSRLFYKNNLSTFSDKENIDIVSNESLCIISPKIAYIPITRTEDYVKNSECLQQFDDNEPSKNVSPNTQEHYSNDESLWLSAESEDYCDYDNYSQDENEHYDCLYDEYQDSPDIECKYSSLLHPFDLPVNQQSESQSHPFEETVECQTSHAPTEQTSSITNLDPQQYSAYQLFETTNDNYFVTGEAGCGKSYLLRYFIKHTKKKVLVSAPTGLAAININGVTLHSLFGLESSIQNISGATINVKKHDLFKAIDTLIIDEISMVRVDVLDMVDHLLRLYRSSKSPFGGCQIIAFGDPLQLPPIAKTKDEREYLLDNYGSVFFFAAPCYRKNPFKRINLSIPHRQSSENQDDRVFLQSLNDIRVGQNVDSAINAINRLSCQNTSPKDCIVLTPTNAAAKEINYREMAKLEAASETYIATVSGDIKEEDVPVERKLVLKKGSRIIMIANGEDWVNGSQGIVTQTSPVVRVSFKLKDGQYSPDYAINKYKWEKREYQYDSKTKTIAQRTVGTFEQYPIKLAYAMTIHKSQGQTISEVCIDYSNGRAFAPGQTYVALSRCKQISTLSLVTPMKPIDVQTSQEVLAFMQSKDGRFSPPNKNGECEITWLPNNRISVSPPDNPKKVSGSRFPTVLGKNKYKTPFEAWCEIMRVYEKPFEGNKFTKAGEVIEPKQYEYVKQLPIFSNYSIISPHDVYGDEPKQSTGYDFFHDEEAIGGMWDYIAANPDGTPKAVFEMKTTSVKNRLEVGQRTPEQYLLQSALYACLLDVDEFYVVYSFLQKNDYDSPEDFVCTKDNTIIKRYSLKELYPDFKNKTLAYVRNWWIEAVSTGISPEYDVDLDNDILTALNQPKEDQTRARTYKQNQF